MGDVLSNAGRGRFEQIELDRNGGSCNDAAPGADDASVDDDTRMQYAAIRVVVLGMPWVEDGVAVTVGDEVFVEGGQQIRRLQACSPRGAVAAPESLAADDVGHELRLDQLEARASRRR